jgi:N4-gp56 family major capsid protein
LTDYPSGIGITTSPYAAKIVGTYIEKEFYGFQQPDLQLYRDAKKYVQPKHGGNTARFPIVRSLDRVTGTITEGDNPAAAELIVDAVEVSMTKKGNAVQVTKELWKTGIEALSKQVARELRVNANDMVTYNIQSIIASRGNRSRIDLNPAYQVGGTVDSATSTTLVDDALEAIFTSDDDCNGGIVTIVSGPGKGQARVITDYTASGGSLSVAAWDVTPTTASKYKITLTDGIDSSLPMTSDGFLYAKAVLGQYEAPKFGKGVRFRCMIDDAIESDMIHDDFFSKTGMYSDPKKMEQALIGKWMGIEVGVESRGWLEAAGTAGTYSSGAAVHNAIFYSPDSFGAVALDDGGESVGGIEFYNIMTPDHTNRTLAYTTHSYDAYFASAVPFGLFLMMMSCGTAFAGVGDVGAI